VGLALDLVVLLSRAWWDWPLTWLINCYDTVGKIIPKNLQCVELDVKSYYSYLYFTVAKM